MSKYEQAGMWQAVKKCTGRHSGGRVCVVDIHEADRQRLSSQLSFRMGQCKRRALYTALSVHGPGSPLDS